MKERIWFLKKVSEARNVLNSIGEEKITVGYSDDKMQAL